MAGPLRCRNKKHADLIDPHTIEVKCSSRFCGAGKGIVVLHRFDLATGEVTTRSFSNPPRKD